MDTTIFCAFLIGFFLGAIGVGGVSFMAFLLKEMSAHTEAQDLIYNFVETLRGEPGVAADPAPDKTKPETK